MDHRPLPAVATPLTAWLRAAAPTCPVPAEALVFARTLLHRLP